jgi:hypothetical protein
MICLFPSELSALLGNDYKKKQHVAMLDVLERHLRFFNHKAYESNLALYYRQKHNASKRIMKEENQIETLAFKRLKEAKDVADVERVEKQVQKELLKKHSEVQEKVDLKSRVAESTLKKEKEEAFKVKKAHAHTEGERQALEESRERLVAITQKEREDIHRASQQALAHVSTLALLDAQEVEKLARTEVKKIYGTVQEETSVQKFSDIQKTKVHKPKQPFCKVIVPPSSSYPCWKLYGKIDGEIHEKDGIKKLIEHKQRTKRQYIEKSLNKTNIPQLDAYLYLTGAKHITYLQTFQPSENPMEQTTLELEWDAKRWTETMRDLTRVVLKLHWLLVNEGYYLQFLRSL